MKAAPLRCQCGKVTGVATHLSGLNRRFVCYCLDCQVFAHFLKRTPLMLDPNGGTEVAPVHPARIRFTQGIDQLACVRLSSDGMMRWYTQCCQTPVANTQTSAGLPFAGVHGALFERKEMLGPIYARSNGRAAYGSLPAGVSEGTPPKMMVNALLFLVRGLIGRLHAPSPFFDTRTGAPRVEPVVLPDDKYEELIVR